MHKSWPRSRITQTEMPGQVWAGKPKAENSPGCFFPLLQAQFQPWARKSTFLWGRQAGRQRPPLREEAEACPFYKPEHRGLKRLGDLLQVPGIGTRIPATPGLTVDK